jgi:hypothetical protein
VDYDNESDMKCNHEAELGLLKKNEYDIASVFDPSCSSRELHLISRL